MRTSEPKLLVSFDSEVRQTSMLQNDANFGIGTLAPCGHTRCSLRTAACALWAHADRFVFGSARAFSRFSAKRKNSRLVERQTSRSSKLEALWYSLLYRSEERRVGKAW